MGYYNVSANKAVEADDEDQAVERAFASPISEMDALLIASVREATEAGVKEFGVTTAMYLVGIIEKLQADAGEWQYEGAFEVDQA